MAAAAVSKGARRPQPSWWDEKSKSLEQRDQPSEFSQTPAGESGQGHFDGWQKPF